MLRPRLVWVYELYQVTYFIKSIHLVQLLNNAIDIDIHLNPHSMPSPREDNLPDRTCKVHWFASREESERDT